MNRIFSSVRVRVILAILAGVFPAILLLSIAMDEGQRREADSLMRETLVVARAFGNQEEGLIDGARQLLVALSLAVGPIGAGPEGCRGTLDAALAQYPRYLNLGVADIRGTILCSALPVDGPVSIADRRYFSQAVASSDFAIGEYQIGRITHTRSINFGYPLFGEGGDVTGVVFAAMDLRSLAQVKEGIDQALPTGSILTVTDADWTVLTQIPSGGSSVGVEYPVAAVRAAAQTSFEGVVEAKDPHGTAWVYAFVPLASLLYPPDLHVILAAPKATLLADVNRIYARNIYIMIAVGALLVVVTWIAFEFSMIRQVRQLYRTTKRITHGDLRARSPLLRHGTSELNDLSASFNAMADAIRQREDDLVAAYDTTLEGWVHALDLRDQETEGHTKRVTDLAIDLARAVGLPEREIVHLRRGALLHDIGKLGIPDHVLLKAERLTEQEWSIMKRHPLYADHMLSTIDFLRSALDIPRFHHEKWDGSGYPRGLRGEDIPLSARIFSVVDVWDALTSDRPYRPAWTREKAVAYLRSNSGKDFDPRIVEIFIALLQANGDVPANGTANDLG